MLKTRTVRINLLLVTSMIFSIVIFHFMELVNRKQSTQSEKDTGASAECLVVSTDLEEGKGVTYIFTIQEN